MKIGNINNTKTIMDRYNIKAKKKFGQNFLVDENTLRGIVKKANVNADDYILEIGCGIGALTQLLCEKARYVYAFEVDKSLKTYLETNLKYDNLELIFKDFLSTNLNDYLPYYKYKVVANLPYYITTPILFKILESSINFNELYVMMQKEVGIRLKAVHGCKEYNALSIMLQVNYDIEQVLNVSRNVFFPAPNVDSVVIKFIRINKYQINNYSFFSKFIHDCFRFKRKTLKNNLKEYNLVILKTLFESEKYSLQSRAEQVDVESYVRIVNEYDRRVVNEK
ncbi:MAG: 16S rRNA (adenine(1518)-N(6)/adenine(1519)-N(6))-dimethyltransferase RsmA [Bacilli bacterium]